MNRRTLLRLALLPPLLAGFGAHAETQPPASSPPPRTSADLERIQAYLDGLRALKAHFLQVAPNGSDQPRHRLAGAAGADAVPVRPAVALPAGGRARAAGVPRFQLQQTTNIPLSRTPLGILLADHVTLSGDVTVTGMQHLPGQIQVTLVRTGSPGEGSLTLEFADTPLACGNGPWWMRSARRPG